MYMPHVSTFFRAAYLRRVWIFLITGAAMSAQTNCRCWATCLEQLHAFTVPRLLSLKSVWNRNYYEITSASVKHLYHQPQTHRIELPFVWHSCCMFGKSRFRFLARIGPSLSSGIMCHVVLSSWRSYHLIIPCPTWRHLHGMCVNISSFYFFIVVSPRYME
jgi:hypothetical protein